MNLRIITVCIILSAAMTLAQKDFPSTDVDAVVPEVSLVEDESPMRSSEDKAVMHAMKKLKAWCQVPPLPSPPAKPSGLGFYSGFRLVADCC